MLTKAYVSVLLLTAVGPIFIIVGGFQGWLKSLASNLAVFATIGPMLAISFLFLASGLPDFWFDTGFLPEPEDALASLMPFNPRANAFENSAWSPPFLPGGEDMDVIWLFASFVIMTLIPNVANIIKSMIDRRPFGYGTAIGAAIGAAAGTAWSPFGSVAGYTKEAYMKERGSAIATAITKSKYGQAMRRFLGG